MKMKNSLCCLMIKSQFNNCRPASMFCQDNKCNKQRARKGFEIKKRTRNVVFSYCWINLKRFLLTKEPVDALDRSM